jgi:dTDP-4-dehydrorhamnose 3,5-epimerase
MPTALPDVLIFEPKVFCDARGFFLESFNARVFREATGLNPVFVQDNHSYSTRGVLRGLHYQVRQPQGRLSRVTHGRVFNVVVDVREGSSFFGRWVGVKLDGDVPNRMLWTPPGFAHGFVVLSDRADFLYKTTSYYVSEHERCILWNDLDIGIDWPLEEVGEPLLSERDRAGRHLINAELCDP